MKSCDHVTERVALGEPLGELAEHVAGCARCQRTVSLPAQIGRSTLGPQGRARRDIDPGLGFSARMQAGAQHELVVRQRRRVVAAATVSAAAAAVLVFAFTREPSSAPPVALQPQPVETPTQIEPEEAKQLVRLADTKRARKMSAHWARIQRPLAPYRSLVQQTGTPMAVQPVVAPPVDGDDQ